MDKYQTALALFHAKFNMKPDHMTKAKLRFRYDLINEEVQELKYAIETENADEIVDALGDILYLTFGTTDLIDVDLGRAFLDIQRANMAKRRGTKPGREQSGGFDVIKPKGWVAPDHNKNHGILEEIFNNDN